MSKEMQLELRKARLAVSPACNLFCNYCDGPNGRKIDKPGAMEDFRANSLEKGIISAETYLQIIQSLYDTGFRGITLTGGEPFLNKDWDKIIRGARDIGMEQTCVTTNGTLLKHYLDRNNKLPDELTLLTVSFDTFNPDEFASISQVSALKHNQIVEGVRMARKSNPDLAIRANKVTTRSGLGTLPDFVTRAEGLFDEINLLNLILKDPKNETEKNFFKREFVFPNEVIEALTEKGYVFTIGEKYEPTAQTQNGLKIIIKDTDKILRSSMCEKCPIYCQEGFYTMRVGTDGSIRPCIDYRNELPHIDGADGVKKGALTDALGNLMNVTLDSAVLSNTLGEFLSRHNIRQENLNRPKNNT